MCIVRIAPYSSDTPVLRRRVDGGLSNKVKGPLKTKYSSRSDCGSDGGTRDKLAVDGSRS